GGKIKLPITVKRLQVNVITRGSITVSGKAESFDISVRTGGEYYAEDLKVVNCDITVLADGKAKVTASGLVDARVTAGCTIEIFSKPYKIEKDQI
ncbi:MAG: DUF2807 domain-containing protein, partial [Pricia sp.]